MWHRAPCGIVHHVASCTMWHRAPCGIMHHVASCTMWHCAPCGIVHHVASCTMWQSLKATEHPTLCFRHFVTDDLEGFRLCQINVGLFQPDAAQTSDSISSAVLLGKLQVGLSTGGAGTIQTGWGGDWEPDLRGLGPTQGRGPWKLAEKVGGGVSADPPPPPPVPSSAPLSIADILAI